MKMTLSSVCLFVISLLVLFTISTSRIDEKSLQINAFDVDDGDSFDSVRSGKRGAAKREKNVPVIILKLPRSGSSWMSSLLVEQENTRIQPELFSDNDCKNASLSDAILARMRHLLTTVPDRDTNEEKATAAHGRRSKARPWLLGFTLQPNHCDIRVLEGMQKLVEELHVRVVAFVRTNVVKHGVSLLRSSCQYYGCHVANELTADAEQFWIEKLHRTKGELHGHLERGVQTSNGTVVKMRILHKSEEGGADEVERDRLQRTAECHVNETLPFGAHLILCATRWAYQEQQEMLRIARMIGAPSQPLLLRYETLYASPAEGLRRFFEAIGRPLHAEPIVHDVFVKKTSPDLKAALGFRAYTALKRFLKPSADGRAKCVFDMVGANIDDDARRDTDSCAFEYEAPNCMKHKANGLILGGLAKDFLAEHCAFHTTAIG